MPNRKKPIGQEWQEFEAAWYKLDHKGKVALAAERDTTYDVAKHWIMEGRTDPKDNEETRPMRMSVEDLLATRPAINLDFVSFDIETSNLTADFSIMLSAVIKPFGCPPIVFRADSYDSWYKNRADDKEIVEDVADELRRHAIVVSHYGSKFDVPFMRAKMVHHGLEPLPQMFGVDSWRIAKLNFQVSSRRLKNLARYFDIGEKEQVEGDIWMQAAYDGNREAMDRIVEHNIRDCEVLEKLAAITFPLLKAIPRL